MTARENPRDPSIPNAQNIERDHDVEDARTGLRERPTRVLGQISLPGRNHKTMEPWNPGKQFGSLISKGESHFLEGDLFPRRRVWFHGSHLRQAPRLIQGIS